ncbi:MAG: acetyltransferase [Blastococcus sp.]|nr:acetyltransferase [Blastococcus sp.]
MSDATRLISPDDAPALSELLRQNREFLAPWEPLHDDDWFTAKGQDTAIRTVLARHEDGTALPHVVLDADGELAGRITLANVVRGAFLSANLGYWVAANRNGKGLASAAVRHVTAIAFGELGLHRVEAGTLVHNSASQRVLERTGFVRFGLAPRYVRIAGRWQDHVLFQLLNEDGEEGGRDA